MATNTDGGTRRYECVDCGERTTTEEFLGACPDCGGRVRNLAVPREQ